MYVGVIACVLNMIVHICMHGLWAVNEILSPFETLIGYLAKYLYWYVCHCRRPTACTWSFIFLIDGVLKRVVSVNEKRNTVQIFKNTYIFKIYLKGH